MNNYKKNSFNVRDLHVSKKEVTRPSWWIRLINWLRRSDPKREYIWTVRLTIDNPRVLATGDYFMSVTEEPYKCLGKIENSVIAVSLNPLEEHSIVNPCVVIRKATPKSTIKGSTAGRA